MQLINSPTEKITFQNYDFYIKRDDLLHKDFSGNKARKLIYFLEHDFSHIDILVSHGSAQSNAMYSLSVLAKLKGWRFIYYVDHIASYLKENPNGNYKYALENGMEIVEDSVDMQLIQRKDILFIHEGGANKEAEFGIKQLADEIKQFKIKNSFDAIKIFLPSGTGTTALFLQKHLDDEVLSVPCVGDREYLKYQFLQLNDKKKEHPTILKPKKKYHFGKLYRENYEVWCRLKDETNIEFDLLYDPIGWNTLLLYMDKYKYFPMVYIHQGGVLGNPSMIERYERKYL